MNEYKCPHCDGPFEIPSISSTVVCPYCSTTVQLKTGEVLKEHYVMRLQYSVDQIKERMLSWALKQLGVPKALENKADIKESRLVFWPFWIVEVEAVADYRGIQKKPRFGESIEKIHSLRPNWVDVPEEGHIDIERDICVPAGKGVPKHLEHYKVPTRRKEFFQHDLVTDVGGEMQPIVIDRSEAITKARKEMEDLLEEEVKEEVDKITEMDSELQVPAVFLIHVPVWHITYSYSVRTYDALIDGASGRVIYLEYPRKLAFRAMTLFGGLLHLVIGGGIGLFLVCIGIAYSNMFFPTTFGIVFGLGMLAFSLRFFKTAMSLKAGEEMPE
jgi:DNA-directed RNA polymerase subunit RPC12/RpoP